MFLAIQVGGQKGFIFIKANVDVLIIARRACDVILDTLFR